MSYLKDTPIKYDVKGKLPMLDKYMKNRLLGPEAKEEARERERLIALCVLRQGISFRGKLNGMCPGLFSYLFLPIYS